MKTVLVFTKTNWAEPPRIRHQITQMLLKRGYRIIFFEKNHISKLKIHRRQENGIKFISHFELIHHQLRPFKILVWLNNSITEALIKSILKNVDFDSVLNFCYDYSFLKKLFPNKKIVTFINDDFELQAKPWMKDSIHKQIEATCKNSDAILTVSYPLLKKLQKFQKHTGLMLPWAESSYTLPKGGLDRDTVLYYGYINHRVDLDILLELAMNKTQLLLVGPVEYTIDKKKFDKLLSFETVEYRHPSKLSKINLNNICCSILCYDRNVRSVNAATMSNRGFNLLALGIPLLYVDLPFLLKAPKEILTSCSTKNDYLDGIEYYIKNFDLCQVEIEKFLGGHYEENRFDVLKSALFE